MIVLLAGATGFIGSRVARALRAAGCTVRETRRQGGGGQEIVAADFSREISVAQWQEKLVGVDVVVNAVGIIRERPGQSFEQLHEKAPIALFRACVAAGVAHIVQISALGADDGTSRYFTTKHRADQVLESLPITTTIVQPALVYGRAGTSARLFDMLASLPVIAVPGRGEQRIQPVHIDDLIDTIVRAVATPPAGHRKLIVAGARPLTFRDYLQTLRRSLGLRRALVFRIPIGLMRFAARLAGLLPRSLLDPETLAMLEKDNVGSNAQMSHLLGRPPRPPEAFIAPDERSSALLAARMTWLLPLLRFSVAAVWIWTAIVSFGLYPVEDSYALLAAVGVPAALRPLMLYGAAALDAGFGVATLVLRRRRPLWLAQMALIVGYTIIISVKLPEFWLHPYGPLLKNLPMLAAIYLLYALEPVDDR